MGMPSERISQPENARDCAVSGTVDGIDGWPSTVKTGGSVVGRSGTKPLAAEISGLALDCLR
jgi:hypothetical protein